MKTATYTATRAIVDAYLAGAIKAYCAEHNLAYHCAMMRLSRFRKEYPKEYSRMVSQYKFQLLECQKVLVAARFKWRKRPA